MIATSDIIILTVSSALLAVALVRSIGSDQAATDIRPSGNNRTLSSAPAATGSAANRDTTSGTTRFDPADLTPSQLGKPSTFGSGTISSGAGADAVTDAGTNTSGNAALNRGGDLTDSSSEVPGLEYATYVVRSGDSLSKIANQFGTTVTELQSINDLSGTTILVGQTLSYPLR